LIDHVICSTVTQECRTSNVASNAGFPDKIPCHTVTLACISANVAMTNAMGMLSSGYANAVIAGGTELLSDVPIKYSRKARKAMLGMGKAKTPMAKLRIGGEILKNLLPPELPAVAEFTSGEVMGHSGDRLATAFNVTRREQDEFALRSHTLAYTAAKQGKLSDIVPVVLDGKQLVEADNGIRVST
ncbi:hypothetical protein PENTCL1PPCAC_9487, partial [Pristionchus entomophagus]